MHILKRLLECRWVRVGFPGNRKLTLDCEGGTARTAVNVLSLRSSSRSAKDERQVSQVYYSILAKVNFPCVRNETSYVWHIQAANHRQDMHAQLQARHMVELVVSRACFDDAVWPDKERGPLYDLHLCRVSVYYCCTTLDPSTAPRSPASRTSS